MVERRLLPARAGGRRAARVRHDSPTIDTLPDAVLLGVVSYLILFCDDEYGMYDQDYFLEFEDEECMGTMHYLLGFRAVCRRFADISLEPELWSSLWLTSPSDADQWKFKDLARPNAAEEPTRKTGEDLAAVRQKYAELGEWVQRACSGPLSRGMLHVQHLRLSSNLLWLDARLARTLLFACRKIVKLVLDGSVRTYGDDEVCTIEDVCQLEELRLTSLHSLQDLKVENMHSLQSIVVGDAHLRKLALVSCYKLEHLSVDHVDSLELDSICPNFRFSNLGIAFERCSEFDMRATACNMHWWPRFLCMDQRRLASEGFPVALGFTRAVVSAFGTFGGAPLLRRCYIEMQKLNWPARKDHSLRHLSVLLSHAPLLEQLMVFTNTDIEWAEERAGVVWPTDARANTSLKRLVMTNVNPETRFLPDLLLQAPSLTTLLITFTSVRNDTGPWPVEAYAKRACGALRDKFTIRSHEGLGLASAEYDKDASKPGNPCWGCGYLRRVLLKDTGPIGFGGTRTKKAVAGGQLNCIWRARGQPCPGRCDLRYAYHADCQRRDAERAAEREAQRRRRDRVAAEARRLA